MNDDISAQVPESQAIVTVSAARKKKQSHLQLRATTKPIGEDLHYCAKAILEILHEKAAAGQPTVGRDELLDALKGKTLRTKQDPIRILYYWKKFLLENGYMEKVANGVTGV